MVKLYEPDRGDIVMVEFSPQSGREQAGRRPALVISPHSYNSKVGLMIACPITSKLKGYSFEVLVPSSAKIHGAILVDHIKSLDWNARSVQFVEKISGNVLNEVIKKLELLIAK